MKDLMLANAMKNLMQLFPDGSEKWIEENITARLEAEGKRPRRQVSTETGIMDIVTDDTIYEIKAVLSRDAVFKAVGQLLLYKASSRSCYQKMVIAGVPGDGVRLQPFLANLNIGLEPLPCFEFTETMQIIREAFEFGIKLAEDFDLILEDANDKEIDKIIAFLEWMRGFLEYCFQCIANRSENQREGEI